MTRTSYETLIGGKRIKVVQNDNDKFDVSYGTTKRTNLSYGQAATCLGEIIFYALVLKGQIKTPSILDDSEYAQQESDDADAVFQEGQGDEGNGGVRAGERGRNGSVLASDQDSIRCEVEPAAEQREDGSTVGSL